MGFQGVSLYFHWGYLSCSSQSQAKRREGPEMDLDSGPKKVKIANARKNSSMLPLSVGPSVGRSVGRSVGWLVPALILL